MTPNIKAQTEWPVTGAAYWGGVLGAVAVIGHEVHTGISGRCPEVDPFIRVMAELAVVAPAGAVVLGMAANLRNWVVRKNHSPQPTFPCPGHILNPVAQHAADPFKPAINPP